MADRYTNDSRIVSIAVKNMTIRYGFRTTLTAAKGTVLGHAVGVDANGVLLPGVILGANSPKPPRAAIKRATGELDSSFVSTEAIAGARTAGWKVTAGQITIPRRTPLSIPVFVRVDSGSGDGAPNYNYGWRMPKFQYDLIAGEFGVLGITEVTSANYGSVWFGVNSPKPARATKAIDTNSDISTFVASAKEAGIGVNADGDPTGWSLVGGKANRGSFGL